MNDAGMALMERSAPDVASHLADQDLEGAWKYQMLDLFDLVQVICLNQPERPYDGTARVTRPPCVGDMGVIVHILGGNPPKYIVENVDEDGYTVWLADFEEGELERQARDSGEETV